MTSEKIAQVAKRYQEMFEQLGIPAERMNTAMTLRQCSVEELLKHGHYLALGIADFAKRPDKIGKANRHLGFVQAVLSMTGLLTLDGAMNHNRSIEENGAR